MRQRRAYAAIREAHEETGYPIELACKLLHAARSAYHKWASGKLSQRAAENERLADTLEKIHEESPDKGYRRLNDDLRHILPKIFWTGSFMLKSPTKSGLPM